MEAEISSQGVPRRRGALLGPRAAANHEAVPGSVGMCDGGEWQGGRMRRSQ